MSSGVDATIADDGTTHMLTASPRRVYTSRAFCSAISASGACTLPACSCGAPPGGCMNTSQTITASLPCYAAFVAVACFDAYAVAAARTHSPSSCAALRAASRSRFTGRRLSQRARIRPSRSHRNSSRPLSSSNFSAGSGSVRFDRLRLRNGEVHKSLTKLVVALSFDPPSRELAAVRRVLVVRTEHHERWPPPAIHGVLRHGAAAAGVPAASVAMIS